MQDFVNCGSISIKNSSCIRATFSRTHCRDCEDICVVDAIKFSPFPSVKDSLCIRCGLCYSACRFSAISIKKDNKSLLNQTKDLEVIDIGCVFSVSDIKVSCISRITEDVLIGWFSEGKKVIIKRGFCKNCKFKTTLVHFNRSIKKAIVLAKIIGVKPYLRITTEKSRDVYIPKEIVTRREVFTAFKNRVAPSSSKREILIEFIKGNIQNDLHYSGAGILKVSQECNLCGVCEYVCPTAAILIKKESEMGFIYFNPSLCVNCKECEEACLNKAILVETSVISTVCSKPKKVFEIKKRICRECGKEFYSTKDDNLCKTCRLRIDEKDRFINFLKNL